MSNQQVKSKKSFVDTSKLLEKNAKLLEAVLEELAKLGCKNYRLMTEIDDQTKINEEVAENIRVSRAKKVKEFKKQEEIPIVKPDFTENVESTEIAHEAVDWNEVPKPYACFTVVSNGEKKKITNMKSHSGESLRTDFTFAKNGARFVNFAKDQSLVITRAGRVYVNLTDNTSYSYEVPPMEKFMAGEISEECVDGLFRTKKDFVAGIVLTRKVASVAAPP